jgi:hypothetical protein
VIVVVFVVVIMVLDLNVDGVATFDLDVVANGRLADQLTDDVKVNVKGGDPLHVQVKDHENVNDHVDVNVNLNANQCIQRVRVPRTTT